MMGRWVPAALVAAALGAGCGGGDDAGRRPSVHVSLPLQGAVREQTTSMVDGARLALDLARERGAQVPRLVVRDDATAAAMGWEAGQVSSNARAAARDGSAVAYVGEFDSGGTAVSLPITNAAGLLHVAPTSTSIALTQGDDAERLRPSGRQTFARLAPADDVQAAALAAWQRSSGCRGVAVLDDAGVYGRGIAGLLTGELRRAGLRVLDLGSTSKQALNLRVPAARLARSGLNCFFFGGAPASRAAQVWRDVHAAAPRALLFGPDGLADPTFARELGRAESRTRITAPALAPDRYGLAAQRFFAAYERRFKRSPAPAGIYGFEAMDAILAAIAAAGSEPSRDAVLRAFLALDRRGTALGDYRFLPRGDSTIAAYGGFRVEEGELAFDRVLRGG